MNLEALIFTGGNAPNLNLRFDAYRLSDASGMPAAPTPSTRPARVDPSPRQMGAANTLAKRPEWSSNSVRDGYLTAEAVQAYRALFAKLRVLETDQEDGVPAEAAKTAREMLQRFIVAKWSPPRMTWHSGDAVVLYWNIGDAVHAFTFTEGEGGYVQRHGRKIQSRIDSMPANGEFLTRFA